MIPTLPQAGLCKMSLLARYRLKQTQSNNRDLEGSPEHSTHGSQDTDDSMLCTWTGRSPTPGLRFLSDSDLDHDRSPPPLAQPQWECTSSFDETLEAEHMAKCKKIHALDTCQEFQLEDDALDHFAMVSSFSCLFSSRLQAF